MFRIPPILIPEHPDEERKRWRGMDAAEFDAACDEFLQAEADRHEDYTPANELSERR